MKERHVDPLKCHEKIGKEEMSGGYHTQMIYKKLDREPSDN